MSGVEAAAAVAAIVGIIPVFQSTFKSLKNHLKMASLPNEPSEPLEKLEEKLKDAMGNIPLLLKLSKSIEDRFGGMSENLNQFRKATYAAQDLVDELDYEELQLKVLGAAPEGTAVHPLLGSGSNSSSKVGCFAQNKTFFTEYFKHGRITAKASAPPPSHSKVTGERIRSTVEELNRVASLLKDACSLVLASSHTSTSRGKREGSAMLTDPSRVTTSTESNNVYGRDGKRDEIINMLETRQRPGNNTLISIIGLFGVGGVGKTKLARYVFNNEKFPESSYSKVWNHVSDEYVHKTIIKEMIMGTASSKEKTSIELQSITNMDDLERMLKDNLKNKQLLLVLDDVWSDQWTEILPVLHTSNNLNAKIVVTTREKKNLKLPMKFSRDCKSQILELEGLDDVEYRKLFDEHSFGAQGPSGHQNGAMLQPIGWQIANKLKGNPLAAETVGAVLMENKKVWYWTQILNSDLCSIDVKNPRGIMPALLLSYLHLPTHLQSCFSYCAIFPKGYIFEKEDLVNMWIAQSYVSCSKEGERPEDVGLQQFEDLVLRSFFKQSMEWGNYYKMHDLLHDLAMFVSLEECCVCHSENWHRVPETCHHLFIPNSSKLLGILTGQLPESLKLRLEHVRTLVIDSFDETTLEILKSLKKVRVLKCIIEMWPRNKVGLLNMGHLKHIRYLDLSTIRISNVAESICTLYHLQTLIFDRDIEIKFPEQMCNLVNLRHLIAYGTSIASIKFIGKLTKLQKLAKFDCQYNNIGQLMEMNELGGELPIMNISNVDKIDDAVNARLEKKQRLTRLQLSWGRIGYMTRLGSGVGFEHHDDVLKCLRPNDQLEQLYIIGHPGCKPPSWIAPSYLKCIQRISLAHCSHWQSLSGIAKMPHLKFLCIKYMRRNMTLVIELDNEDVFPSLVELDLWSVSLSFKKNEEATTVHEKIFPLLQKMSLEQCQNLKGLTVPSSLKDLSIESCNVELPSFLKGLSSLTNLRISHQHRFTSFDREVMDSLSSLKKLTIVGCKRLHALAKGEFPASLEALEAFECSQELHDQLKGLKSSEWYMYESPRSIRLHKM